MLVFKTNTSILQFNFWFFSFLKEAFCLFLQSFWLFLFPPLSSSLLWLFVLIWWTLRVFVTLSHSLFFFLSYCPPLFKSNCSFFHKPPPSSFNTWSAQNCIFISKSLALLLVLVLLLPVFLHLSTLFTKQSEPQEKEEGETLAFFQIQFNLLKLVQTW